MNKLPEDCFHLGIKLLLESGGKILLLEKQHPTRGIYWELPGGRLQKGETVMETLRREMEEETGWQDVDGALPFDMVLTNMRIPTPMGEVGLVLFVYRHEISSIFSPRLSSEHTNFGWFTFLEAVELLKNQYSEVFIEKIARMGSPLHFIKITT
jgi:8-oxo-dGTP diphosphatase